MTVAFSSNIGTTLLNPIKFLYSLGNCLVAFLTIPSA
jgi:hypothetical protein